MKHFGYCLLLGIVLEIFVSPPMLSAGAWGQNKGDFFLSLQPYFYGTDEYYDEQGNRHDRGGTFSKYELNPYMEYGLTEKDTVILNIFYDWLSDDASGSKKTNQGFADQEIAWQHRLFKNKTGVLAVQGLLILPTGYDIEDNPRLGYDRFGAEAGLLYGRIYKLFDRYGFLDLHLGFRDYFGYPSSQIRTTLTAGYDIFSNWQILAEGELQYGLDNGTNKALGPNLLVQPNYRLLKLTLGACYRINANYSLVAAGYRHAWGENTGAGGGGYVSLWYSY